MGLMSYQIPFLSAIKLRRSVAAISRDCPISDAAVVLIVQHAIKYAPSAFDVQSARAVVIFGAEHDKLWDYALEHTRQNMPPPVFEVLKDKILEYKAGHGTVMFFEDTAAVQDLPPRWQGLMKDNAEWYDHSNGMNQFIVWTALAADGIGCTLQHYTTAFTPELMAKWNIPSSWRPQAQLVFGQPIGPPRGGVEKTFKPLEGRVISHGAAS